MISKQKWLAVAKYGSDSEKNALAANLRITPTPTGFRCSAELAFDNSVRGFYAEEVARLYLEERKSLYGLDYKWLDDGIVWEKEDVAGPHVSQPDAFVTLEDGSEAFLDVKSNMHPSRMVDLDGVAHIIFSRTHNAQLILWYQPSTGLHVCKRLSPMFSASQIWGEADYQDLGVVSTEEYEAVVDHMLQTIA